MRPAGGEPLGVSWKGLQIVRGKNMPRIYDSGNDPLDFCKDCYPPKNVAVLRYGDVAITGEGPDKRGNCFGYDAEHPDYDYEEYECIRCHLRLDWQDN